MYDRAESGIFKIYGDPKDYQDIEEYIWREEATDESQGTRTELEALQMKNQIQGALQESGMS